MRVTGSEDGVAAIAVEGLATGAQSTGVRGFSDAGEGVRGHSLTGEGIHAHSESAQVAALAAFNVNPNGTGAAVFGHKTGDLGFAGFFDGHVHVVRNLSVEGDITLPSAADVAEDFSVRDSSFAEPGTVMVLTDDEMVRPSDQPYDKRVAGVISGAGPYRPGIVLDGQSSRIGRCPIALVGKVYCWVDAQFGPVHVGDLLTTSSTAGHAMRASDAQAAFGAVIGKALRAVPSGRAVIPIFVALQ